MREYVVRVRQAADGTYSATVRECAPGVALDVRPMPHGAAGIGAARTAAGAVVSAVVSAGIPSIPEPQRSPYAC